MKSTIMESAQLQGLGAYELLRHEILHGELMPGDRLRASELNNRYELGLTPIREALMRLSSEGLIDTENHRGARVREVSLDEFCDMMQCRREIEYLCLSKAIANGSADWEGEVLKSFHLLSRAPLPSSDTDREAATQWEHRHRQFHYSLVSACNSPWLLQFWSTLVDHSERYRKFRLLRRDQPEAVVRDVIGEHESIMQAMLDRNEDTVIALMNEHLQYTENAVVDLLLKAESQPK